MENWLKPKKTFNPSHYGMPNKLFKDNDKDGVPNVFDCKPFNKKKQDVISPPNFGSPVGEMYGRQEQARLNKIYLEQVKEFQKLEEERAKELARLSTPQYIDRTVFVPFTRTAGTGEAFWDPSTNTYYNIGKSQTKSNVVGASITPKINIAPSTNSSGSYNFNTGTYTSPSGNQQGMGSSQATTLINTNRGIGPTTSTNKSSGLSLPSAFSSKSGSKK